MLSELTNSVDLIIWSIYLLLRETIAAISLDVEGVHSHEYNYIEKYSKSVVETNLAAENDVATTPCPADAPSTVKTEEKSANSDYETNLL